MTNAVDHLSHVRRNARPILFFPSTVLDAYREPGRYIVPAEPSNSKSADYESFVCQRQTS